MREEPRAVAVLASHVTEFMKISALGTANARRPCGIEFVGIRHEFTQKILHLRHHGAVAEEWFIAHAPDDDAGMVAMNADHVAQAGFHARLKAGHVSRVRRIGAGRPRASKSGGAPETILRPKQNTQFG